MDTQKPMHLKPAMGKGQFMLLEGSRMMARGLKPELFSIAKRELENRGIDGSLMTGELQRIGFDLDDVIDFSNP